jgi:hypothetical protein
MSADVPKLCVNSNSGFFILDFVQPKLALRARNNQLVISKKIGDDFAFLWMR